MTPRLRELEAQKDNYEKRGDIDQNDRLDYLTLRAHIRGYKMALDDLKPVLTKAAILTLYIRNIEDGVLPRADMIVAYSDSLWDALVGLEAQDD